MKQLKKRMPFQINIILRLKHTISKGFSLVELVLTITLSTLLITTIVGTAYFVTRTCSRAELQGDHLMEMADLFDTITYDVLNPDIYPHPPRKDYDFADTNQAITFFARDYKITYEFIKGKFYIKTTDKKNHILTKEYSCIKDFEIVYNYDSQQPDDFPDYCQLTFTMNDKKELKLNMRL